MNRFIPLLLLLCLLFSGCAAEEIPAESTTAPPTTEATPAPPAGTYDPFSQLEAQTNGAVKVYPLNMRNVRDIQPMQDKILVFSGGDNDTTITQLSGDILFPEKSISIGEFLYAGDFHFCDDTMSYFSVTDQRSVVLDIPLREIKSIEAPAGLVGTPILSADQSTLYYCTENAVRAKDLGSGISRLLKEIPFQDVTGMKLHLQDSILEISFLDEYDLWRSIYISTDIGQLLWEDSGELILRTSDTEYFASYYQGTYPTHLFGIPGGDAKELLPAHPEAACFYLPGCKGVVTTTYTGDAQILDYYDLQSGMRTGTLSFSPENYIHGITQDAQGSICFISYDDSYGCDVLYRWNPALTPSEDSQIYTADHYTEEMPDYAGLEECARYAQELSLKYGVDILVYKQATAIEPIDYDLVPEHNVLVIQRELEFLDKHLQNYPEGFLNTLSEHFDGLRICIAKELIGSAEAGSLDTAEGVQFWNGETAYIALAAHANTERALYHEMCHLIESVVLTQSNAYDRWDTLNPSDFAYDNDYVQNIDRDGSKYLQEGRQAFIDTYSMSFAKEDRARIMEYAMTEGNAYYFESRTMQAKLLTLCEGIRDAFGLKKSPESFLWEQYLHASLAYTE